MTEELCYPSEKTIIKQVILKQINNAPNQIIIQICVFYAQLGNAIKKLNATYVYIASDDNYMIPNFQKKFKKVI